LNNEYTRRRNSFFPTKTNSEPKLVFKITSLRDALISSPENGNTTGRETNEKKKMD